MARSAAARSVRTLFLSDVHLGFKRARVRELAEFLQTVDAECIVLAGDIVDHLNMAQSYFWNDDHARIVQMLLAKRRAGSRLLYIPGNHDSNTALVPEMLRGQVEVHRDWVHETAQGQRLLVVHGDQFDEEMTHTCSGWVSWLGNALYDVTVAANHRLNDMRRALRQPYWPMAERLKLAVSASARYIAHYEDAAIRHATRLGYDGILCGHIHRANLRRTGSTLYCNTGDWVETCSAVIETAGGDLQLLHWSRSGHNQVSPALAFNPAREQWLSLSGG
jgi:UDP-2,3-diacylglucosamine pyrophosphatase LpxH